MNRPGVDPGLFKALLIAAPIGLAFYGLVYALIVTLGPTVLARMT